MYFLNEYIPLTQNMRLGVPLRADGTHLSLFGEIDVKVDNMGHGKSKSYMATAPLHLASCLEVKLGDYMIDNSGINSKYLDADINWSIEAWAVEATKFPGLRASDLTDVMMDYKWGISSEVSLLYNLVRQYYALTIKAKGYKGDDVYYEDGHVRVTLKDSFGITDFDKFALSVSDTDLPLVGEAHEGVPHVAWDTMSEGQATVLRAAVAKQRGVDGVGLLASTPQLAERFSTGDVNHNRSEVNKYWQNLGLVEATLMDLVKKGRLYNQFETALQMAAQTGCHFKAPVAEAVALQASNHKLVLPRLSCFRFGVRNCLLSEMGGVRPSALATFEAWLTNPTSFWLYAALTRSAAEHKGAVTYGTDFDVTGATERNMDALGIAGNVGRWVAYASQATGRKMYVQPGVTTGVTMGNIDKPIPFEITGDLTGYQIVADVGEGVNRRIQLQTWNDERRTGYHPRLLHALGFLKETKAGSITRLAKIEVQGGADPDTIALVRGEHVGAYLTMCRAHGWNAVIETAPGRYLRNWADNHSRMSWTPAELKYTAATWYRVTELTWRGEPLRKRTMMPSIPGTYEYEMKIGHVGVQYEYGRPVLTGRLPAKVKIVKPGEIPKIETTEMDIEVGLPVIEGQVSDFQMVRTNIDTIAPPEAVEEPLLEAVQPPEEDEQPVG